MAAFGAKTRDVSTEEDRGCRRTPAAETGRLIAGRGPDRELFLASMMNLMFAPPFLRNVLFVDIHRFGG